MDEKQPPFQMLHRLLCKYRSGAGEGGEIRVLQAAHGADFEHLKLQVVVNPNASSLQEELATNALFYIVSILRVLGGGGGDAVHPGWMMGAHMMMMLLLLALVCWLEGNKSTQQRLLNEHPSRQEIRPCG
uniref:Uncharacterized protein n=1 Tax=Anopheles farauti TaxID=69004 RepID=A0A182R021_9DIPT